ncbi:MAG: DUF2085 domain-containing protein [Anaerolineae bacterium]|nr:DUF2085 domain-containing protein [Anaerolineae bacterium]MBT4456969.1 DUF2085 domain-containing protein [Anaerolineae bacterium]MBT4843245.1 DUF2085 domain-containing protein [Anaerolineae bacterium]MBT7775198.1 DUF2085 domain-containing protein [Anaerolineae bacterium]
MNKNAPVVATSPKLVNWFFVFILVYGVWVWTPFLAPLFMHLGWEGPAKAIYFVYSFFCHQLPERSYFFFGSQINYSLSEIQAVWGDTINPLLLRKFIGTAKMGWKVAWSDRMISFYGGVWFFALLWYPLRRVTRSLHPLKMALLLLSLAVDGLTHMVSDMSGIGLGFRDSNLWLATLTQFAFSPNFYAGDALGSFNSWMRIITGLLAGLALVWFAFPYIALAYSQDVR